MQKMHEHQKNIVTVAVIRRCWVTERRKRQFKSHSNSFMSVNERV